MRWHKGKRVEGQEGTRVGGHKGERAGGHKGKMVLSQEGTRVGGYKGKRVQGWRVQGHKSTRAGGYKGKRAHRLVPLHPFTCLSLCLCTPSHPLCPSCPLWWEHSDLGAGGSRVKWCKGERIGGKEGGRVQGQKDRFCEHTIGWWFYLEVVGTPQHYML